MNVPPEKLHELLTYCTEFAETMLKDSGEFYPFGAALDSDLKIRAVGAHNGDEHPAPGELCRILGDTFIGQARSSEIAAAAIACDGFSRYIYVPYSVSVKGLIKKSRSIIFYEPIAVGIDAQIFKVDENA